MTSVHSPFDSRILQRECSTLAEAGYDVVLLAPHSQDEARNGVRIRALPKSKGRLSRMLSTTRHLMQVAIEEHGDVYHFHDPELLPVGMLLALRGKRVIYDAHEDVPRDIMSKEYLSGMARRFLAATATGIEWTASRMFAGVVGATPTITERFPMKRAVTVQNFPRFADFPHHVAPYSQRPRNFIYVGSVTELRGGVEMLEAIGLAASGAESRLVMCGHITPPDFSARLRAMPEWRLVDYRGWCDPETLSDLHQTARAGLVLLHPTRAYHDSYPGKMFEYMASGLPVIASDFPVWREILGPLGAGILVDPKDPKAISAAMRWILENPQEAEAMGARGREAVRSTYNWEREGAKLLAFYDRVSAAGNN